MICVVTTGMFFLLLYCTRFSTSVKLTSSSINKFEISKNIINSTSESTPGHLVVDDDDDIVFTYFRLVS